MSPPWQDLLSQGPSRKGKTNVQRNWILGHVKKEQVIRNTVARPFYLVTKNTFPDLQDVVKAYFQEKFKDFPQLLKNRTYVREPKEFPDFPEEQMDPDNCWVVSAAVPRDLLGDDVLDWSSSHSHEERTEKEPAGDLLALEDAAPAENLVGEGLAIPTAKRARLSLMSGGVGSSGASAGATVPPRTLAGRDNGGLNGNDGPSQSAGQAAHAESARVVPASAPAQNEYLSERFLARKDSDDAIHIKTLFEETEAHGKAGRYFCSNPNVENTVESGLRHYKEYVSHMHEAHKKKRAEAKTQGKDNEIVPFAQSLPPHAQAFNRLVTKCLLQGCPTEHLPLFAKHFQGMQGICEDLVSPVARFITRLSEYKTTSKEPIDWGDLTIEQRVIVKTSVMYKLFQRACFDERLKAVRADSKMKDCERLTDVTDLLAQCKLVRPELEDELQFAEAMLSEPSEAKKTKYLMDTPALFAHLELWFQQVTHGTMFVVFAMPPFYLFAYY